jgi:hypothetical protein
MFLEKSGRPLIQDRCFQDRISKAPLDYVLCYCDTIVLKTLKSRENNERRCYFDYCGITTTEYK